MVTVLTTCRSQQGSKKHLVKKTSHKRTRTLWATLLVSLGLSGFYTASGWAADSDFNSALTAANSGNISLLDNYQFAMQDSVLAYYPEYWKLNTDLATQSPQAILSFVGRYSNSAMAEKLAADYVEEKVKTGDIASARALIAYVSNPDEAESCAVGQVQAISGDPLAISEFNRVWLRTNKQPESCDGLARLMVNSPLKSAQDRQQRLWTMLRAGQLGNAVQVAQSLGINLNAVDLTYLASSPLTYLQNPPLVSSADHAKFLFALARLADTSVDMAASQLALFKSHLPIDVQRYGYRVLAYKASNSVMQNGFNPQSVSWFDQSYGYPFSDEEAESYARQAVRFNQWEAVLRAVDSMSLPMQQERSWQYWFARASEQRSHDPQSQEQGRTAARAFYTNLALQNDYYGLLSRDRLGQSLTKLDHSYHPTAQDLQRLDTDIHFRRAFALRNINAPAAYSNREWNWAVRQAYLKHDDGMILAAASRANNIGWYDRAIYAAERTTNLHNYELQFLTPYREQVVQHSNNVGIDPAWVYGLIRQESRFILAARSHVGAGGLMQIMPDTAKWIAGKLGESYSSAALSNMQTNIRYGTYYLSHIQGQLSNQPVLATAGYNAGPNRARRWQPGNLPLAGDQYAESIPLLETRDYVKNVMTNTTYYALLFGRATPTISERMSKIPVQFQE
ncbi:transglycosylase SLT domain-containing protein [Alkanindiges sp. WGS2144]|uniref:lytic transglycosylase domain-containing protein n=1 Tax=Alkanindiges sp. WGS2144 TaxID=3366808 RepID=UPI003751953B